MGWMAKLTLKLTEWNTKINCKTLDLMLKKDKKKHPEDYIDIKLHGKEEVQTKIEEE